MFWNRDVSLFSPQPLVEKENRGLLVQFLLSEVISAHQSLQMGKIDAVVSAHPRFFPYDWGIKTGYLNRAQEHALLLRKSFPDHEKAIITLEKVLEKTLFAHPAKESLKKRQIKTSLRFIYLAMEPLIEACKENENLLFFLLKNHQTIDALTQQRHLHDFLQKIHPDGLEILGEKMCDQYHQRGFFSQIPEFKLMLNQLCHG